jgi:hypothetical protein
VPSRIRTTVDRLEPPGRDQPRPRVGRHAVARPLFGGGDEGFVQPLLGKIEIADESDQRGEDAPRLGAVDVLDQPLRPARGFARHR